jgi:hypothetical protein
MGGSALGGCRIGLALLTLVAVAAQFAHGVADPPFHVVRFFSFFTIESNLLAAGVLLVSGSAALRGRPPSDRLDMWRGAATLYMATTGIVYVVMLSGQKTEMLAWANFVVHYLMPVALVLDWAVDRPRWRITFRRALVWMAFPVAFIAYSLVRGAMIDWYPYPFVDVGEHGYPAVLATSAVLGLGMLGMIWLLAWTTSPSGRRTAPEPAR